MRLVSLSVSILAWFDIVVSSTGPFWAMIFMRSRYSSSLLRLIVGAFYSFSLFWVYKFLCLLTCFLQNIHRKNHWIVEKEVLFYVSRFCWRRF